MSNSAASLQINLKFSKILTPNEYNKSPISEGQKIKAIIHFGGDEWFNGYFLSDTKILQDTKKGQDKKETKLSFCFLDNL